MNYFYLKSYNYIIYVDYFPKVIFVITNYHALKIFKTHFILKFYKFNNKNVNYFSLKVLLKFSNNLFFKYY